MRAIQVLSQKLCVFIALVVPGVTHAVVVTFTDEASFLSATAPVSLESFEASFPIADNLTFDDFSLAGANLRDGGFSQSNFLVSDGASSVRYQPTASTPTTTATLTFTFDHAITAFGLTLFDLASTPPGATLSVSIDSGLPFELLNLVQQPISQDEFVGIQSTDSFTTIELIHFVDGIEGDTVLFDELYYTQPMSVSEPSTIAVLLAGMLGLGAAHRRGKRRGRENELSSLELKRGGA